MDASLPVAILGAALAIMLGFVSRRLAALGVGLAGCVALAAAKITLNANAATATVTACWVGVLFLAVFVYLPRHLSNAVALCLSGAAGLVGGIAIATTAAGYDAYPLVLAALLVIPTSIAVARGFAIAPRVVMSWLVAVSVLGALLPYVVAHPGYVPDHRD